MDQGQQCLTKGLLLVQLQGHQAQAGHHRRPCEDEMQAYSRIANESLAAGATEERSQGLSVLPETAHAEADSGSAAHEETSKIWSTRVDSSKANI